MLALTINGNTEQLPESQSDDAMRRFWEAKQAGDPTAHLVTVAANQPLTDDDDDDPPPAAPGAVSPLAAERIALHDTWLTKAGFAVDPPLYAPGTRVLPLGDQNFRLERAKVEALPVFTDAATRVTRAIRNEQRRDISVPLRQLRFSDYGTLCVGDDELAVELPAFYQLANLAGFGMGGRYLAQLCDAELRATNVNAQLQKAPDRPILLRSRVSGDSAQVYATVTPTYTAVDTDSVLAEAEPVLRDARVQMLYDGTGIRANALWMPDQVVDLAAGDIFKAGVRIETDDTGHGRVRISAVVFRNRCLNLLIIGEGTIETLSAVHKGDGGRILARVREGIAAARGKIADFLAAWGHARTVLVDPEALLADWVKERKLGAIGERERDAVVEALLSAWHKEPGYTLADSVNAVSRAAHEQPTWSIDFREELERRASQLVYVPR